METIAQQINVASFTDAGTMMFADTSRGKTFSKDPAVVSFRGHYFMYYSVPPGANIEGWRIGIAQSSDLIVWEKQGELAVAGECESKGFCAPGAIVLRGAVHLFYQSYGNGKNDAICHAWSADGINFERNPQNPIFKPRGEWNCGRAIDADVIEHEGELLLYYASRDPEMKKQLLGVACAPIDSDFGTSAWSQLDLDGSILKPELPWEQLCIEAPALCQHNGLLYMFYAGAYNNCPQQVGCAVSRDGIRWERLFINEPFLANGGEGSWNHSESGHPYAFTDEDGTTHLFFQGNNDQGKTWFLSKVKIGWQPQSSGVDLPFVSA